MTDTMRVPPRTKTFRAKLRQHPATPGRSIGLDASDTAQVIRQLERGLPYAAIDRLHRATGLPVLQIASALQIPERTLMRRKAAGRFRPDESERLLRISRVFDKAVDLFEGDAAAAMEWLTTPLAELSHQRPLDFAKTEVGARDVEDLIGRLEHGVFS